MDITQHKRLEEELRQAELILLVEDESAVRAVVRSILEENGYRLLVVGSSLEALERRGSSTPMKSTFC